MKISVNLVLVVGKIDSNFPL